MKLNYSGKGGRVFVANVTAQNHELNFRLPDHSRTYTVKIAMGKQVQLVPRELSTPEIDSLVQQLGPYGFVEVGQESAREKIAYLFHVGAPVPFAKMQAVYERNRGILTNEGAERRKTAAIAANAAMNTDETPLKNMTMDIEEVDSGSFGNDSDKVGEGFKIDNEAVASNTNLRPRRSRVRNQPTNP